MTELNEIKDDSEGFISLISLNCFGELLKIPFKYKKIASVLFRLI